MINSPITRFATEDRADAIAAANREGEVDGWTYEVVPSGDRFVILIRDDTGYALGYI